MKRKTLLLIVIMLCLFVFAHADDKRAFTVEDLWKVKRVSGPELSPDGKWLAITVTSYCMEENKGSSDIWLLATDGSVKKQLTTHSASDSSPAWSPDSKKIAFVSNRDESGSQIWVINTEFGEARRVTDFATGSGSPKWSADGKKIYFVTRIWPECETQECLNEKKNALKENKVKAHVVDYTLFRYWNRYLTDGSKPTLYCYDFDTKEYTDILKPTGLYFDVRGGGSGDYAISPDGKEMAVVINNVENPGLESNSDIFLINLENYEARNITVENKGDDSSPLYSPDGKLLAFSRTLQPMVPEYSRLTIYDRESGELQDLTADFEYSPRSVSWKSDSSGLYFNAGVRGRAPAFFVSVEDKKVAMLFEGGSQSSLQVSDDGDFYFNRQRTDLPPTIYARDGESGEEVKLTDFNDELLKDIKWHTVEIEKFMGAAGDEVEMFVLKPADFDPNKKYPLVHLIHGGPHGAFNDSFHFRWNAQLFVAPGYVGAMVNFHGSSGYGQDFYDSIAGAEADKPFEDIMKATDYLIAQGYIDEDRMAAGGGSYGGYQTNWIATQTDRFACLFSHAGGFNHHGMFASDSPRFRERRWGGYPWLYQANTDRQSPNRFARNIKTPTMVIHGELDYRVVVTQGIEFYNTMQIMGVPSKLIIYPDEGHWITKPQNARLWWNEIHSWLENYIGK